ncbi:MAG TPA: hypothetical protein VM187_01775, partial [Niastella sp.]|nr:hypothetical protein [Niastella sp.]
GKPVVSTAIKDVVTQYGETGLVHIISSPDTFIEAVEKIQARTDDDTWLEKVDAFLSDISWNKTWQGMKDLINSAVVSKQIVETKENKYV